VCAALEEDTVSAQKGNRAERQAAARGARTAVSAYFVRVGWDSRTWLSALRGTWRFAKRKLLNFVHAGLDFANKTNAERSPT
jgi:hypothetical protein